MSKLLSIRRLTPLAALVAGLALGSCGDLLTESPPHMIVVDNLYTDITGFDAAVTSLYALARLEQANFHGSAGSGIVPMIVGTDMVFAPSGSGHHTTFNQWGSFVTSQNIWMERSWTWFYQVVNGANTIINRAENPAVRWTPAQKNRVLAEAKFFRAWAYRHLTYMFGDVPLNLEEASGESVRTDWERTPVAEVRRHIEQDLLFAEQHLPAIPDLPVRVTSAAAAHYLAELYLAMGDDAQAEQKAQAVINSGHYRLITERYGVRANQPGVPFMDQFYEGNINRNQGNTEVLWAFQFAKDVAGGGEANMRRHWAVVYEQHRGVRITVETGGRGISRFAATRWALNNYEPEDHRGSHHAINWFLLINDPTDIPPGRQLGDTIWQNRTSVERQAQVPDWPWTKKWQGVDPLNPVGNYEFHPHAKVRLAETYLLLAEAQFNQGKLADAAQTLNLVRQRSNASAITPGDVTLNFILDERARELLAEEQRRYTLIRTGTWLERTRRHNPLAGATIAEHNVLFPIPQAVIDANLDRPMPQNPGY
jgi:starch-binding outer membrane protein, SusD/RagB family